MKIKEDKKLLNLIIIIILIFRNLKLIIKSKFIAYINQ